MLKGFVRDLLEEAVKVGSDADIESNGDDELPYPVLADEFIDIERLPVTGAELIGRQAELQLLDEAWESETTNIVSLVAGGVWANRRC